MHSDKINDKIEEAAAMKRAAFFGATVSTISTITAIVFVPMLYNYIHHVQSSLDTEIDFCQHRTIGLIDQFEKLKFTTNIDRRPKRNSLIRSFGKATRKRGAASTNGAQEQYGGSAHEEFAERRNAALNNRGYTENAQVEQIGSISGAASGFCTNCMQGRPGLPGVPGNDGTNGLDGKAGRNGEPGKNGDENLGLPEFCFECAKSLDGPPGRPGPKGPPGLTGPPGCAASVLTQGAIGPPGPQGEQGAQGLEGPKGPSGIAGAIVDIPAPSGPPGPIGVPGDIGVDGSPGERGKPGKLGEIGEMGDEGEPGLPGNDGLPGQIGQAGVNGNRGSCDHCPIPRTSAGY